MMKTWIAGAIVAALMGLCLVLVGCLAEGPAGPSGGTTECDRVCNEQIDITESRD